MKLSDTENKENGRLTIEDYELISYIFSSDNRAMIIISLLNGLMFPKHIKKNTQINYSIISKCLRNLEQKGLIKCQNPNAKRGRIFTPTEKVMRIRDEILRINCNNK